MAAELTGESKPFYKKPENILVYGIIAALTYVGLLSLDAILPLVTRVLENLVYTSVLFGGLAIVGFLAVNKDVHRIAWAYYTSACRFLLGRIVELDPIGIMRGVLARFKQYKIDLAKAISALRGQERELEEKITERGEKQTQGLKKASYAKKTGNNVAALMEMRKVQRTEDLGISYQKMLNEVRTSLAMMNKISEAADFYIADVEDTIEVQTEKRRLMMSQLKALSAGRRILAMGQERELLDMAVEANNQQYFASMGEFDQFMDDSKSFIQGMDLSKGMIDDEAMDKLLAWEGRVNGIHDTIAKTKFRVNSGGSSDSSEASEDEDETKEKRQSFADLFEKLDK